MIYNEKNHNFKKYFDNWDLSKNNFVLFGASKECIQLIRTIKIILPQYDFKIKYLVDLDETALGNNISLYDINKAAYKSEINTDILNDKILEVGEYNFNWDGANSSSGIYIIRLNTSSKTSIKKAILTK